MVRLSLFWASKQGTPLKWRARSSQQKKTLFNRESPDVLRPVGACEAEIELKAPLPQMRMQLSQGQATCV